MYNYITIRDTYDYRTLPSLGCRRAHTDMQKLSLACAAWCRGDRAAAIYWVSPTVEVPHHIKRDPVGYRILLGFSEVKGYSYDTLAGDPLTCAFEDFLFNLDLDEWGDL